MRPVVACLLFALACQRSSSEPVGTPPSPDYAADIAALCDSVARSGADQVDDDARALTIANWLGTNLKTPESRKFLVQIQPLVGEPKATALETEAKRVGLPGCALAAEWRTPATH